MLTNSKIIYLLVSCSLLFNLSFAQDLEEKKKEKNYSFIFQFDGRRSFVLNQPSPFSGLKIGVEYKEVHDFGLGFYATKNAVRAKSKDGKNEILARLNYNTLFYQYAFYHDDKWEFSVPIQYGGGRTDIREVYIGTDSTVVDQFGYDKVIPERTYAVSELGVSGQYKVWRWFGIGTGLGYRFTYSQDKNIKNLLNAPTYSFKFKIFFGELYRAIKEHKLKKKENK